MWVNWFEWPTVIMWCKWIELLTFIQVNSVPVVRRDCFLKLDFSTVVRVNWVSDLCATQKQCDIVECCQPTASSLCSLHASLQSVSATSDGHVSAPSNTSTGECVMLILLIIVLNGVDLLSIAYTNRRNNVDLLLSNWNCLASTHRSTHHSIEIHVWFISFFLKKLNSFVHTSFLP